MDPRRCLLVSVPLDLGRSSKVNDWVAIGNGTPVPSFIENFPIYQHWALCVVDCEDVDCSQPASRDVLLEAKYFDLSVDLETCFIMVSRSRSYGDVFPRNYGWPKESVKSISAIQDMGITTNLDEWIFERGYQMTGKWGKYLPLQWNCQHFALFLSQMTIDTIESRDRVELILEIRKKKLYQIFLRTDLGVNAFMIASHYIPVLSIGIYIGLWIPGQVDGKNMDTIKRAYLELQSSFEELRRIEYNMWEDEGKKRWILPLQYVTGYEARYHF